MFLGYLKLTYLVMHTPEPFVRIHADAKYLLLIISNLMSITGADSDVWC